MISAQIGSVNYLLAQWSQSRSTFSQAGFVDPVSGAVSPLDVNLTGGEGGMCVSDVFNFVSFCSSFDSQSFEKVDDGV